MTVHYTDEWPLSRTRLASEARALAAALDRQWFYDGLPLDADDEAYALADAIYENVIRALVASASASDE